MILVDLFLMIITDFLVIILFFHFYIRMKQTPREEQVFFLYFLTIKLLSDTVDYIRILCNAYNSDISFTLFKFVPLVAGLTGACLSLVDKKKASQLLLYLSWLLAGIYAFLHLTGLVDPQLLIIAYSIVNFATLSASVVILAYFAKNTRLSPIVGFFIATLILTANVIAFVFATHQWPVENKTVQLAIFTFIFLGIRNKLPFFERE